MFYVKRILYFRLKLKKHGLLKRFFANISAKYFRCFPEVMDEDYLFGIQQVLTDFTYENIFTRAMIPSGCTCHLQSLDLVINTPFKDAIRKEILKYIEIGNSRNQKGNLIKPSKDIFCECIRSSWNSITESKVNNALKSG